MAKRVIALVTVLALAAVAPLAGAADSSACYRAGELTLNSVPGSFFRILGEQPDGAYLIVADGVLDPSGSARLCLPACGPMNGQPQFQIEMVVNGSRGWLLIPDEEAGWGWD